MCKSEGGAVLAIHVYMTHSVISYAASAIALDAQIRSSLFSETDGVV